MRHRDRAALVFASLFWFWIFYFALPQNISNLSTAGALDLTRIATFRINIRKNGHAELFRKYSAKSVVISNLAFDHHHLVEDLEFGLREPVNVEGNLANMLDELWGERNFRVASYLPGLQIYYGGFEPSAMKSGIKLFGVAADKEGQIRKIATIGNGRYASCRTSSREGLPSEARLGSGGIGGFLGSFSLGLEFDRGSGNTLIDVGGITSETVSGPFHSVSDGLHLVKLIGLYLSGTVVAIPSDSSLKKGRQSDGGGEEYHHPLTVWNLLKNPFCKVLELLIGFICVAVGIALGVYYETC
jgi:hypothetical protein